ncbi:MAG TPA: endonuclease/exonuclease/phosphatase family protein [Kofleriaceae bacterium]|nr:endonuclease/exonuclease/phosphatase family protein [Kofleriaceae bacterium]
MALLATIAIEDLRVRLATTHLRWDPPGTPTAQRWAIREARELIANLPAPSIICGDLNVEADDEVHRLLHQAGFVDPHLADARPTCNPNGRAKRIDYILHTRDLRSLAVPPQHIADHTPLPSSAMPSDHLPIEVMLGGADPRR